MTYKYQAWPAWCNGPNGETEIFEHEEDVPAGWEHHGEIKGRDPLDHDGDGRKGGSVPKPIVFGPVDGDTLELDAEGHPWSADLHAATKTKTSAGLWRMKVGVKRPAPIVHDL